MSDIDLSIFFSYILFKYELVSSHDGFLYSFIFATSVLSKSTKRQYPKYKNIEMNIAYTIGFGSLYIRIIV